MKRILPILLLTSSGFLGCASTGTTSSQTELPVSRVVMYQSGIGYVERNAVVADDELVLRIRPDQINDILKSLTVIDRGNGRPISISLPVDQATLDRLAEIPDQVRSGGIRSLLYAFRGAHVKIKTRSGSHDGRIVGVDEPMLGRELTINMEEQRSLATVTLFTDADRLDVIPLDDIKSVDLYDASLAQGLQKSLNISLNEGDWKQIELHIKMDSSKKRELAMSYLVAMPTWKPAYRLILEDNQSGTLQGWAIISNVTGSDWNNISFSLVSGQPMSFTYDLYKPQFLTRPDLSGLAVSKASAPKISESTYNYGQMTKPAMVARPSAAQKNSARMAPMATEEAAEAEYMMMDMADEDIPQMAETKSVTSQEMIAGFSELASKSQIGSFDEYKLASKLSVPDGNTALVNLIQRKLVARDTRMFEKPNAIHAFNAYTKGWRQTKSYQTIELKNEAGVALDAGPITIYRDQAVIGEGYLSRTEKDATAYITFANEGRLTVSVADTSTKTDYVLDSFRNGTCTTQNVEQYTAYFEFDSKIPIETTALLQIPDFGEYGWDPVDFPENVAKGTSSYVVSVNVPGNGKVTVPLTMRNKQTRKARSGMKRDNCLYAIKNALNAGEIGGDQAEKFKKYLNDSENRASIQAKINELNTRKDEINIDQKSLTETLRGLKDIKTSNADSLKNQLLNRQKSNEKELVNITSELYTLQVQRSELNLALQSLEKELDYTRTSK
ncbi:MAG: hypothetical protein IJ165_01660 [Proteobacteria bacterium]|nr:hypothetical protein [Pseudomonadota bacterium]